MGLPLAVTFAEAGITVVGFDKNKAKVDKLNRGDNYISDITEKELKNVIDMANSKLLLILRELVNAML